MLNGFDVSNEANIRIVVEARDISTTCFKVRVASWSDTVLYMAGVTWIATTEPENTLAMGSWSTSDVRPWNQPRRDTYGPVTFPCEFSMVPQLLAGFSQIDLAKAHRTALLASLGTFRNPDSPRRGSTWADTTLYSVVVAWVAIVL